MENDPIKNIALQAFEFAYKQCKEMGRDGGNEDHIWVTLVMGKLTHLLVDECAKLADNCPSDYVLQPYKSPGTYIKESLGVE
jgi:hypothetical protein|tara:strand:+ start:596 stop:841 length:246 start_codon:yes stop_codon:yes gene_type:complete